MGNDISISQIEKSLCAMAVENTELKQMIEYYTLKCEQLEHELEEHKEWIGTFKAWAARKIGDAEYGELPPAEPE